jgi:hypothetical protein
LTWRAKLSVGVPLGLLFVGLLVALDAWLLNRLVNLHIQSRQLGFFSFLMGLLVVLSVPVLVLLVYEIASGLTLRYRLDRNGVTVRWAGNERIIPIRDIQRIVPGNDIESAIVHRRGVRWPGHQRGEGMVPSIGRTRFLATRPLAEQLLLVMPGLAVAISPLDVDGFLAAFEARRKLGPNRLLKQELRQARWLSWPLWGDRNARALLGAAAIINAGLFGYVSARFPTLDPQLPLHFNRLGYVDRIGTKVELFALPIIALIILGTNLVLGLLLYRRERAGSYLLWGAATAAQVLFWLATFSILP